MSRLLDFITAHRWMAWVTHSLIAAVMMVPAVLFHQPWVGLAFVTAWFWSREKVQVEYSVKGVGFTATVWNIGWFPWLWTKESVLDWACPTLTALLIAFLGSRG